MPLIFLEILGTACFFVGFVILRHERYLDRFAICFCGAFCWFLAWAWCADNSRVGIDELTEYKNINNTQSVMKYIDYYGVGDINYNAKKGLMTIATNNKRHFVIKVENKPVIEKY